MIELKDVRKSFGDKEILRGVSAVYGNRQNQPDNWYQWQW